MFQQELVLDQMSSLQEQLFSLNEEATRYQAKVDFKKGQYQAKAESIQRLIVPLSAYIKEAIDLYFHKGGADKALQAYMKSPTKEGKEELIMIYTKLLPYYQRQLKLTNEALNEKVKATQEEAVKGKQEIIDQLKVVKSYSKKFGQALDK